MLAHDTDAASSAWSRALGWLASVPEWMVLTVAGLGIVALSAVDWLARPGLSLLLFYAALVGAVAWRSTWPWSVAAVLLMCAGTAAAEFWGRQANPPAVVWWNVGARCVFFLTAVSILIELRDGLARERRLARIDPLTGAANRLAFQEATIRELARAHRNGTPLAAAFIDLDNLKSINDIHGHEAGDRALVCLASTALSMLRATDVFARIGGDEFGVVLPDTYGEAASQVVERIAAELPSVEGGGTVSVGIVAWSPARLPDSVEEILAAGDLMMYEAKREGGSRVATTQLS